MGGEGLEPPVSERADLQSARLPITGYPPKNNLIEHLLKYKNKTKINIEVTLTITNQILVLHEGFKPPTNWVETNRSIQLN